MNKKIPCILSIKEFTITENNKETQYMAIYPSDIPESKVDEAIKQKFDSLFDINYIQIIIVLKEQYDAVLKPQMDILSKYNQSLEERDECQSGDHPQDEREDL